MELSWVWCSKVKRSMNLLLTGILWRKILRYLVLFVWILNVLPKVYSLMSCQYLSSMSFKCYLPNAWQWFQYSAAKSLQSCPTLCDPIDSSPPDSPIPGILQARTPELVAISLSNAWMWKVKVKWLSPVWLFATPWTAAYQAPLSMGFSRQEYWRGMPW